MTLTDFFFPPRCPFCRRGVDRDGTFCQECQESLPWLTGQHAHRRVDLLEDCASALSYKGLVRGCIHRLKFGRRMGYLKVLGPLASQCVHDHFPLSFDLISYPPLTAKGLRRRGFDQARLLAQAVAEDRGMTETPLFQKKNSVIQQSRLSEAATRRANVLGAYRLLDPALVAGKRVLLVDDVVTTGATLSECARLLLLAGAAGVWGVTVAATQPQPDKP